MIIKKCNLIHSLRSAANVLRASVCGFAVAVKCFHSAYASRQREQVERDVRRLMTLSHANLLMHLGFRWVDSRMQVKGLVRCEK